jgi:hypothetical protein
MTSSPRSESDRERVLRLSVVHSGDAMAHPSVGKTSSGWGVRLDRTPYTVHAKRSTQPPESPAQGGN